MHLFHRDNRLSKMQIACVQDICMASSIEEAITKYILRAPLIPNVSFVKRNESEYGIDLYEPFSKIPDIEKQLYTPFYGGRVSIVNHRIASQWLASKDAMTYTERCVSFDTQTVSYLHRYYHGKSNSFPSTINSVIQMMKIGNIGVDNIPYATENLLFSLDKRDVVLDTLFSFEKLFYVGKKSDRFCKKQAYKQLCLYDKQNRHKGTEVRDLWRKVYAVLLEIARIQLSHPSHSTEKKMKQLCTFMDESLGLIMYPELILAKRYFDHGQNFPFFGRIQKGRSDLIESLQNMAWDLFHLRMLELACVFPTSSRADFFIPYMFTYDKRLLQVKDCYALEALAVNTKGFERFPFYTHMNEITPFIEEISTPQKYEQRRGRNLYMDFPKFIVSCEDALRQVACAS